MEGDAVLISPKKEEIKQLSMAACVRLLLIVSMRNLEVCSSSSSSQHIMKHEISKIIYKHLTTKTK